MKTVEAIRDNKALEADWRANTDDASAAALAWRAHQIAYATIVEMPAEVEKITEILEEKKAAMAAAIADDTNEQQLAEAEALVDRLENGRPENGTPKYLGVRELEIQYQTRFAETERLKYRLEAERLPLERLRLMDEYASGNPTRGSRNEIVYAPLWVEHPLLQFMRLPGTYTKTSYVLYLQRLETELSEKTTAVAAENTRLQARKAKLERARTSVKENTEVQKQHAATLASAKRELATATKNNIGIANVGRYLLGVYPLTTTGGRSMTWMERMNRWAALVRVFHEPRVGFSRGRAGNGEPVAMLEVKAPRKGWSVHEEFAKEPFDVVALPYDSHVDAIRIQGRRWCSDPAFARELIRLSIVVAGLPAGTLKSLVHNDANVQRFWTLMDGRTDDASKSNVQLNRTRIVSFGIAVEVAARRVRARLRRRRVAVVPSTNGVAPRGFESVVRHMSNLIGWDLPVLDAVRLNKMNEDDAAYVSGIRKSLIEMMLRMGEDDGGLTSAWGRTTASTLASGGGSTRRLAVVIKNGSYGYKGQTPTHGTEAFEFGVTTTPDSEQALAELLRFDDAGVFVHLHPTVVRLGDAARDIPVLVAFLASSHSVALCVWKSRYHVLFKDQSVAILAASIAANEYAPLSMRFPVRTAGQLVLIDPETTTTRRDPDFMKAVEDANKALALSVSWTSKRLDATGFAFAGQEGGGNFLIALARALALALGVHRTNTYNQIKYPLLGGEPSYKRHRDQASAVSDLTLGFGPLCIALAALCHDDESTKRFELWD